MKKFIFSVFLILCLAGSSKAMDYDFWLYLTYDTETNTQMTGLIIFNNASYGADPMEELEWYSEFWINGYYYYGTLDPVYLWDEFATGPISSQTPVQVSIIWHNTITDHWDSWNTPGDEYRLDLSYPWIPLGTLNCY